MTIAETAMKLVARLKPDAAPDPLIGKSGAVGASLSRVDGPLKVMGKARFAAEVTLPNLTYAALAYSWIAKGKIAETDPGAAKAAPGVVWVRTYRTAPRMPAPPLIM